ncbi:MAG: alpha/beta fold hydrolase, partial [Prolixibacteraceae bacterium]|nr:alpha/beta fold hydrolase [Prolixibacteraceae bacterium]
MTNNSSGHFFYTRELLSGKYRFLAEFKHHGFLKLMFKTGLILFFCLCFTLSGISRDKSKGVSFYSSQDKENIIIENQAQWEQQRWKILNGLEAVMGPLPSGQNLPDFDIRISEEHREDTYTRFTISFLAFKGERVPAYLYIPHRKGIDGKLPAMVALQPTGDLGKKIVDGEGKANRGYARELAERGYIVIAPDYPSYGDLKDYNFEKDRYQSGTMAAVFYHMRSIDLLIAREDVDPERIGVIGHSLGGHNSMFLAAFDTRLKVIVSSCGWTQFENYDIGKSALERYGGRLGPWAQDRYMPLIRDKYNLDDKQIPFNFHEIVALLAPRAFFSN